jgi:hypothetical protein
MYPVLVITILASNRGAPVLTNIQEAVVTIVDDINSYTNIRELKSHNKTNIFFFGRKKIFLDKNTHILWFYQPL